MVDEDGESHQIYAMDEKDSALKFAEESNINGDYYLMDNPCVVLVGEKRFEISAEPDICYSANEI